MQQVCQVFSNCPCKQNGVQCSACGPSSSGRCSNYRGSSTCRDSVGAAQEDSGAGPSSSPTAEKAFLTQVISGVRDHAGSQLVEHQSTNTFPEKKFLRAFGVPLLNHSGGDDDSEACRLWCGAVSLKLRQYALPDGGVGNRFVHMLSEEIERCNDGRKMSEWESVFTALFLQQNKMV